MNALPYPRDTGAPSLPFPCHLFPYPQEDHLLELCSQWPPWL